MVAEIPGNGVETIRELFIITQQFEIPILHGNETGYLFKQLHIFIPLLVEGCFMLGDFKSHFIDGIP
ncbi:MAG: hypothetical protein DRI24_16690 [Deltaproteobacteria bacterium]|nr:MAG: hypothetical protein DRI24_16690 [Deltaproteobacteria bacterium]